MSWFRIAEFDRDEKIQAVTAIYNKLDVRKATEEAMNAQYEKAKTALEETCLTTAQKQELMAVANALLKRES